MNIAICCQAIQSANSSLCRTCSYMAACSFDFNDILMIYEVPLTELNGYVILVLKCAYVESSQKVHRFSSFLQQHSTMRSYEHMPVKINWPFNVRSLDLLLLELEVLLF